MELNVTITLPVYQLFSPSVPESDGDVVGGSVSRIMVADV